MQIVENKIILDNNYYLEINNEKSISGENIIDIKDIKLKNVKDKKIFLLKINFDSFKKEEYKKIIKRLLLVKSLKIKLKLDMGVHVNSQRLIGYVINYDCNNSNHNDFINAVNAIFYDGKYERYNYIYDEVCDYLDNFFYVNNACDFQNNKCGEKRNTSCMIGCCRHVKVKWLGLFSRLIPCEYLNKESHRCDAKCISCKLFTCDYLEKKGIKFKLKNILLIDVFFNPLQKLIIRYTVFTPKEKILKRLVKI